MGYWSIISLLNKISYLFILFHGFFVSSFPDSASPIMVAPPTTISERDFCTLVVLSANCSSWNQISSMPVVFTSSCPSSGDYDKIIVSFSARENGTQYDRYGALWIGDIEIIRTTTPEPTSDGINWLIEKDISLWALFLSSFFINWTTLVLIVGTRVIFWIHPGSKWSSPFLIM